MYTEYFFKNLKAINSSLLNSLFECEDGKEYFLKTEKVKRLYNLACKKLGLEYDEKYESEELTKEEQDYLMSDELNYFDFTKKMDEKFEFKYGITDWNLELFKQYLLTKKDDLKFSKALNFNSYNDDIIKKVGYEYLYLFISSC